ECDAVALAYAVEHFFHPGDGAVEEVRPDPAEFVQRGAITGAVAEEVVELFECDGPALEIAIRPRLLAQLHHLVARERRVLADVLQHPLVGELDDGVAQVEEEPGDAHVAGCPLPVARLATGNRQQATTFGTPRTSAPRSVRCTRSRVRGRGRCASRRDRSHRRPRGARSNSTGSLQSRTFAGRDRRWRAPLRPTAPSPPARAGRA